MGSRRPRPKLLAEKLLQIRTALRLSQPELAKHLGLSDLKRISKYEHDKNEPPLPVLLAYAKLAGVTVEELIDDDVDVYPNSPRLR